MRWFFYDRGAAIETGKLQNQKSGQCIDVAGFTGEGNIGTYRCTDNDDHEWTLYENGELVN